MSKKTKQRGSAAATKATRIERRERVLETLRAKGIDRETLVNVTEQLRNERYEAEVAAARMFYAGGNKITPVEFSDQLSDAKRRCNGVLAAAMGVIDVSSDGDLSGGLIQLIDDLLSHLTRLECAFSAEIWQAHIEAKAE